MYIRLSLIILGGGYGV